MFKKHTPLQLLNWENLILLWNSLAEPEVFSYVVDNAGPDVKELLLGEKRNEVIKAALDSEVKFVPPTNKSIEIDQPILSRDGSGTKVCTISITVYWVASSA